MQPRKWDIPGSSGRSSSTLPRVPLSLYISHLEIGPGGRVTTHIHPDSEEAMVIVEGSLEAILGDQVVTLGEGDTVLAPAGVKHGFENRSGATARLLAIFPKTQFERVPME